MTENKRQFRAIKGTRDILPPDSGLWSTVEQTARDVFSTYGFGEIRLPIFEQTELFTRSIGTETDVVSKEMYTFPDHDLAQLEWARYQILSKRPPHDDPIARNLFVSQVEFVRRQSAAAIQSGEMPNTPENQQILEQLELQSLSINFPLVLAGMGIAKFEASTLQVQQAVSKLRFGDLVSLRPEATASVVRAYIQNGMHTWPQPVRLFYMGPMFRRERPQKGRYRQFYQIGAEILGKAEEITVDSDTIEMVIRFLNRVGLVTAKLLINSIGDNQCRPQYIETLRNALREVKDKLGPESQRRIETNPLRVLDSKLPQEQSIIEALPHISQHLCGPCRDHFERLKTELDLRGIVYEENWRLVRGLDYYTRTTFELTAEGLGSQDAICGGGRYDGLVELLGGHPTPGFGFAIGTDRLILALKKVRDFNSVGAEQTVPSISVAMQRPDALVTGTSKESWNEATKLAGSLRGYGLSIFIPKFGTKLQRVLDTAHKMEAPVVIIVGEDETNRNQYAVRVLKSFVQDERRDVPINRNEVYLYGRIVKLRQDLGRALARLAAGKPDLDEQRSVSRIVNRLTDSGVLPVRLAAAIRDVMPTLNKAIHGKGLTEHSLESALAYGNLLLNELDKLSPFEAESNA
jgi:histidyl-tRNA synthetase